jgi:lincosamide nucleotidyltransferase A/C/D/E
MNPTESGESNSNQVMSPDAVVHLLQLFEQQGIEVVVDGGWGVDALLGAQTHVHADVDVAIEHKNVPKLRALLAARGYTDVPRRGTWECNFDMGDEQGHEVGVHSYTFDAQRTLVFGVAYPLDPLTGMGTIPGLSSEMHCSRMDDEISCRV